MMMRNHFITTDNFSNFTNRTCLFTFVVYLESLSGIGITFDGPMALGHSGLFEATRQASGSGEKV
jgi:hypothetical protein